MSSAETTALRFVRALLPDRSAELAGGVYEVVRTDRIARLGAAEVGRLADEGVLAAAAGLCRPGPRAKAWVMAQQGARQAEAVVAPGVLIDLEESPLARLASGTAPFLLPHHVEAGERVRRLVERARLSPRVTMSYDPTRIASRSSGQGAAGEVAELGAGCAAQAR